MMKAITITISMLLAGIIQNNAAAQRPLETSAQKQQLDSVIAYFLDNSIWVSYGKDEFAYDTDGNATLQNSYGRDSSGWYVWQTKEATYHSNGNAESINTTRPDTLKNVFTYNEDGKLTLRSYYTWDGSQWIDDYKNEYTYDSSGNNILILQSRWDGSQWLTPYKVERVFDANGNITEQTEYLLYSMWVNYSKIEYYYDAEGHDTLRIGYNGSGSQWVYSFKIKYTYDANGYRLMNIGHEWDGSQWVNPSRQDFTHDANGNVLLYVGYNWVNSDWVLGGKTEWIYDGSDNLIAKRYYSWDGAEWVSYRWEVSNYDTGVNPDDLILPDWVATTYYSNHGANLTGKILDETPYNWNESASAWDTTSKTTYFYSDVNTDITPISDNTNFNLYPNPSSQSATLDFSSINEKVKSISIINMLGEQVAGYHPVSTKKLQLQTSALSAGIYIIELKTEGKVIQKKLVVQ